MCWVMFHALHLTVGRKKQAVGLLAVLQSNEICKIYGILFICNDLITGYFILDFITQAT
jgi:hypothetical protein